MNVVGSYFIRILFHLIIVLGIWQILQPIIEDSIRNRSQKNDYRREINKRLLQSKKRKKRTSYLINHLDNLLYLVQKNYEQRLSVVRFFIQTIFIFVSVFLVAFITMNELPNHLTFDNPFMGGIQINDQAAVKSDWKFPLFISMISAALPYIRLRYRFTQKSVRASFDLLEIVKILSKYTYLSVDLALIKTSEFLEDNNVLKRPLSILAVSFSNYSSEKELQRDANRFASIISTTFARVFISDLLYAEREGSHVLSASLLELNMAMEQQRETIITVKAINHDAISLGLYVNLLILIMIIGTFMLMLKPSVYYKLQFQTKEGLAFMGFIIASLFIAFAVSMVLSRPKLDYQ